VAPGAQKANASPAEGESSAMLCGRKHVCQAVVACRFWLLWLGAVAGVLPAAAQTFRWGPFQVNLALTAGAEYTDNVNTSEDNPKSDILLNLGPVITGGADLPVAFAGGQRFSLSLSAAYQKSLLGNREDTFGAPITASLTLPIYAERWVIVLSDVFNFTNDPLETTLGFNRDTLPQYSNIASLTATRPFGRTALSFGANRQDRFFPDDPILDETQYSFSVTPSFFLRENYSVFVRAIYGITEFEDPRQRDIRGYSVEVGVSGQITPSINGTLAVGWAHAELEPVTINVPGGIFDGIFEDTTLGKDNIDGISSTVALSYTQPLRPNTTHSISVFRSPGVTATLRQSNIQEVTGVTYSLTHRLRSDVVLSPSVVWTHLEDVGRGGAGEKADLLTLGVALGRQFGRKLSGSIFYRFQLRSSNLSGASFEANRFGGSLTYTF
jgi:hypothetical protein